jgi:uncharacterized C2H2 Zn-finger protein
LVAVSNHPKWANTIDEVVFPEEYSPPVPHLYIYQDGLKCMFCGYINRNLKHIQNHCYKEHKWVNYRKRGRGYKTSIQKEIEVPWTKGVYC